MHLPIVGDIALTEFKLADKAACVERINDPEIYDNTLRIPKPYTEAHFEQWIAIVEEATKGHGEPIHFAIRENETLIGSIGFDGLVKGHRAEFGYWLAKPWRGRGIGTAVVRTACDYAIENWKLVRIAAYVFPSNVASARVLERNGFKCEGLLRKHHLKDGKFLDSRLFALVR